MPENSATKVHRVVAAIVQAGRDRDNKHVNLLRNLATEAKRWAETEADRATLLLHEKLEAMPREALEAFPAPIFPVPAMGDESGKR
jgi:hypothetical protein